MLWIIFGSDVCREKCILINVYLYFFSGDCDEENDDIVERDWNAYWRMIFKPVTVKDITDYEKKYKGNNYKKTAVLKGT